jgi:hypothetical protein
MLISCTTIPGIVLRLTLAVEPENPRAMLSGLRLSERAPNLELFMIEHPVATVYAVLPKQIFLSNVLEVLILLTWTRLCVQPQNDLFTQPVIGLDVWVI